MSQTSFSALIDNSSSFMSIDPQNVALEQLRLNNDPLKWKMTCWNPKEIPKEEIRACYATGMTHDIPVTSFIVLFPFVKHPLS